MKTNIIKKNSRYNVFNPVIIEVEYPIFGRMIIRTKLTSIKNE